MLGMLEHWKNEASQCWEAQKMRKTMFPNIGTIKNREKERFPKVEALLFIPVLRAGA